MSGQAGFFPSDYVEVEPGQPVAPSPGQMPVPIGGMGMQPMVGAQPIAMGMGMQPRPPFQGQMSMNMPNQNMSGQPMGMMPPTGMNGGPMGAPMHPQAGMMLPRGVVPILPGATMQQMPTIKAKAKFDFAGSNTGEMALKMGEIYDVIKQGPSGGWSKGIRGAFPTDYVEFVSSTATPLTTTPLPPPQQQSFGALSPTAATTSTSSDFNLLSSKGSRSGSPNGGSGLSATMTPIGGRPSHPVGMLRTTSTEESSVDLFNLSPGASSATPPRNHSPPLRLSKSGVGGLDNSMDLLSMNAVSSLKPVPMKPLRQSKELNLTNSATVDLLSMPASSNPFATTTNAPTSSKFDVFDQMASPGTVDLLGGSDTGNPFASDDLNPLVPLQQKSIPLPGKVAPPKPPAAMKKPLATNSNTFDMDMLSGVQLPTSTARTTTGTLNIHTTGAGVPQKSAMAPGGGGSADLISSLMAVDGPMSGLDMSKTSTPASTLNTGNSNSNGGLLNLPKSTGVPMAASSFAIKTVNTEPTIAPSMNQSKSSIKYVMVKFDRDAQGSTELSIKKGDILILEKQDVEWWFGGVYINASGASANDIGSMKKGFFPANYVKVLDETNPIALLTLASGKSESSGSFLNTKSYLSSTSSTSFAATSYASTTGGVTDLLDMNIPPPKPGLKLPKGYRKGTGTSKFNGMAFSLDPIAKTDSPCPIWHHTLFIDLFADAFKKKIVTKDPVLSVSVGQRMRFATYVIRSAMMKLDLEHEQSDSIRAVNHHVLKVVSEAIETCDMFPNSAKDSAKYFTFLQTITTRIRVMNERDSIVFPSSWLDESGIECGVMMVVTKTIELPSGDEFSVCIVNCNEENGLLYHPTNVDNTDGKTLRNVALELCNIPADRVTNAAFWFLACKSAAYSGSKSACEYFYTKVLTYLTSTSILSSVQNSISHNIGTHDYRPYSHSGDFSFIHQGLETVRYLARTTGLTPSEADHLIALIQMSVITFVQNDLQIVQTISPFEVDMIRMATRVTASILGCQASLQAPTVSVGQIKAFKMMTDNIEKSILDMNPQADRIPYFDFYTDHALTHIGEWPLFERFKRDANIEGLAGDAPVPPIIRPIELTLVPERVNNFYEAAVAMRHALDLCVLLSNQRKHVRNSYTLRVCLLSHLFIRVIPLPLPLTNNSKDQKCFWTSQDIRQETQSDMLKLLNLLCRHFATASLSVKATRSGDAIRILTFSCMASVCDALLRKIAVDVPAQYALHYAGKAPGPCLPFGFQLGNFAEESEFLKFSNPEATAARTQVLDYFHEMKNVVSDDHMMFTFEKGSSFNDADNLFIDQICIQMGYEKGHANAYLTEVEPILLDHYPEISYFRDLIFMLKLVMVPTSDKLPELKAWTPQEARLRWYVDPQEPKTAPPPPPGKKGKLEDNQVDVNNPEPVAVDRYDAPASATISIPVIGNIFYVKAFGMKLDCKPDLGGANSIEENLVQHAVKKKSFWSRLGFYVGLGPKKLRSIPSQANPSILLSQRVDTEDDILHIRDLPDFDGTLGAKDCELMLQYLTAPYLRIPLLLNFFASETRLKTLRNRDLQEVLDAALFEPGAWKARDNVATPQQVPAQDRDHLHTVTGLLFNEILMSPNVVLTSINHMLEKALDMDTGKFSEIGNAILYIIRLAVRVEGYLLFLIKNHEHQHSDDLLSSKINGAYQEAYVRGLECDKDLIAEAKTCQQKLRALFDDKLFKMVARWIKISKKDGLTLQACILHAHLAYLHRNVEYNELNPKVVFASLACQIYLFNNFKFDIDLNQDAETKKGRKDAEEINTDLIIPQVELFDMFQRNRTKILQWLTANPDSRNSIMDAIVQLVEEGQTRKTESALEDARVAKNWISIETSGINFRGRFIPDTDYPALQTSQKHLSKEAEVNFEAWLRETTTLAVNTEINVQLGEFTIKKNSTRPLEDEFRHWPDFRTVFGRLSTTTTIQCAEVKYTTNRKWVRLPGMNYDLQLWVPDLRKPGHKFNTPYSSADSWIKDVVDPWRAQVLPTTQLFLSNEDQSSSSITILMGYYDSSTAEEPDRPDTLREVIVYRYPKVMHVYNVVEHGRRFYRKLIFSSDSYLCMHELKEEPMAAAGDTYLTSGDPYIASDKHPSLIVFRDSIQNQVAVRQQFIPHRFLLGIMPTALLRNYKFWQNKDDSVTGYMPVANAQSGQRSILQIVIEEKATRRAKISRAYVLEEIEMAAASAVVVALASTKNAPNGSSASAGEDKDPDFAATVDPSKPTMYLINLLLLLNTFTKKQIECREANLNQIADFNGERSSLHALVRMLIRMENLANIVAWSKVEPTQSNPSVSIDLIELPRLRLTFEKRNDSDGKMRYYCLEQSGLYLTGYTDELKFKRLIEGIPNVILLRNMDNEHFALLPATAKPFPMKVKGNKNTYKVSFLTSDDSWLAQTGESTYFVYPVHPSGCFMSSRSVAASLYLLALRLMTKKYEDAFGLIESCVSDVQMTDQEKQMYELLADIKDDLSADMHACRLKLYFVTYGSEIMVYPFKVEEEMVGYLTKLKHIAAKCRLSPDEEYFILSKFDEKSPLKSLHVINRERLLVSSFQLYFKQDTSKIASNSMINMNQGKYNPVHAKTLDTTDPYLTPIDIDNFDTNIASFKSFLSKLSINRFTKPEPMTGSQTITYLTQLFEEQKNPGFFFIYDLMTNAFNLSIIPDDSGFGVGSILFRLLPVDNVIGIQHTLLRVMDLHESLNAEMPKFEDKRKMKLPVFAGMDIFQAHVKACCQFIKSRQAELNLPRLAFVQHVPLSPPLTLTVSLFMNNPELSEMYRRNWILPRVLDFDNPSRMLTLRSIPANLTSTSPAHFNENDLAILALTPLLTAQLKDFTTLKSYVERGELPVDSRTPLTVLEHPLSRSHIARTSLTRLEQDIVDYANDESSTLMPMMEFSAAVKASGGSNIGEVIPKVKGIIDALTKLRDNDSTALKKGINEVTKFCNGEAVQFMDDFVTNKHSLLRFAKVEADMVSYNYYYQFYNIYFILLFLFLYFSFLLFICLYT